MRKLRQIKVWISDFTCTKCGAKITMYHGHETSKVKAIKDIPIADPKIPWSGRWNGWFIGKRNKELCPICFFYSRQHPNHMIR